MDLSRSVAIVTGASKGIGRGIAEILLTKGTKVTICDVDRPTGVATTEEFTAKFGADRVIFVECDVAKKSDLQELFCKTKTAFGCVNILINNAGVVDEVNLERCLNINLHALINGTDIAIEEMTDPSGEKGGAVINIASMAGLYPDLACMMPRYACTKAGVIGYTRSLATPMHFARTGVKFYAICPAFVSTDLLNDVSALVPGSNVDKVALNLGPVAVPLIDVSRVGECVIDVLEKDINGSVVAITPTGDFVYKEFETISLT